MPEQFWQSEQSLKTLWVLEASRRLKAYKYGQIESRSSTDVFAGARVKLKEINVTSRQEKR